MKFIVVDDNPDNLLYLKKSLNRLCADSFHCLKKDGNVTDTWSAAVDFIRFDLKDIVKFVSAFIDDVDEREDIILIDLALTNLERAHFTSIVTEHDGVIMHTPQIIKAIKRRKPNVRIIVISTYGSGNKEGEDEIVPEDEYPKFLYAINHEVWFPTIEYIKTSQVIHMDRSTREKLRNTLTAATIA